MLPPSLIARLAAHWVAYYAAIFEALSCCRPQIRAWLLGKQSWLRSLLIRAGVHNWLHSATSTLGASALTTAAYVIGLVADIGMRATAFESATVLGLVLVSSAWLQLDWAMVWAKYLFPYLVWDAPEHANEPHLIDEATGKPLVGLSIDDVPCTFEKFGPSKIEACLRLLEEHGARATLFVMSQELVKHDKDAKVSDTLVNAVTRGHELGNHDLLDVKTVRRSGKELTAVIRECDEVIASLVQRAGGKWQDWREFEAGRETSPGKEEAKLQQGKRALEVDMQKVGMDNKGFRNPLQLAIHGEPIKWFRPGGGFFTPEMIRIAARHGYSTVLGTCFPVDTHMPLSHNVWYLRRRCGPGKIIIVHDRPNLLQTLQGVLPHLCSKYKLVPLSKLFEEAAKSKKPRKGD